MPDWCWFTKGIRFDLKVFATNAQDVNLRKARGGI
jgi:hypothetical protein